MNAETLSKTDRTSWARIMMVWRFYAPYIKWELWAFPLISLLVASTSLADALEHYLSINSIFNTLISTILVVSPLAFSAQRGREVEAMLPALGFEKCLVILVWSLIVVPILLKVPMETFYYLVHGCSAVDYTIRFISADAVPIVENCIGQIVTIGLMSSTAMLISCLWGVMAAHSHRAVRGILAIVFFYIGVIALTLISSVGLGIYIGYTSAMSDAVATINPMDIAIQIINLLCYVFAAVITFYIIFAITKCCKAIARHQF